MTVAGEYQVILDNIIRKYLPETKIVLFGSRARRTHNPGSDIDIALDNGKHISWAIMGSIKEDIEESNIPFFVDVVDMHEVSDDMLRSIKREGIEWIRNS